jgi:hypothetical protein
MMQPPWFADPTIVDKDWLVKRTNVYEHFFFKPISFVVSGGVSVLVVESINSLSKSLLVDVGSLRMNGNHIRFGFWITFLHRTFLMIKWVNGRVHGFST